MSIFTYLPIIATAGETAEEYADTEKITVIDGGVSVSGTQRMGYARTPCIRVPIAPCRNGS